MLAGLAHFVTHAVAVQITNMLAGYTSAAGNPLPVAVRRAFAPDTAPLPVVQIEARPPSDLDKNLLGQLGGYDAQGNRYYQLLAQGIRCELGVRAATPAERDDLFDFLVSGLLLGINPASSRQWCEELATVSGLLVEGVAGTVFAAEPTTDQGQVFAASTTLLLTAQVALSVATTPVNSLTVVPSATLTLPLS